MWRFIVSILGEMFPRSWTGAITDTILQWFEETWFYKASAVVSINSCLGAIDMSEGARDMSPTEASKKQPGHIRLLINQSPRAPQDKGLALHRNQFILYDVCTQILTFCCNSSEANMTVGRQANNQWSMLIQTKYKWLQRLRNSPIKTRLQEIT